MSCCLRLKKSNKNKENMGSDGRKAVTKFFTKNYAKKIFGTALYLGV